MTIEFHCPHCDKLLKTADDKAGVQASCPGCAEPVTVPAASEGDALYEPSFAAHPSRAPAAGHAAAQSIGGPPRKACPMCGEKIMAEATRCRFCGEDLLGEEMHGSHRNAHRGGLILAFGILGFLVCFPFGITAWVMGNSDLREMAAGRMDRTGEGLTRAGKIIGIITVCMQLLWIGIFALAMVAGIVGNINR